MTVDNKSTRGLRNALIIVVAGLIGLTAGGLGGYVGYSFWVVGNSPLINLKGSSNDSPFDQTYRGMARIEGLELVARGCDGKPVPPGIIEREKQVIDQVEVSAKRANLAPPLNVARAIVAYRSAKIADMRSDKQASEYAIEQGMMFLQASGWKAPSPERLATIVRISDDCQQGGVPKEKK
ncbi:MAG: hypothetical protein WCD68_07095 [Candidatus Acidiferrum sp.]